MKRKMFYTKQLVFCAMAIALATILSLLKFNILPQGGSSTLFSMLVVCLIGYWYGPSVGLIGGLTYGLMQLLTASSAPIHPIQLVLDFFLAFGALGLSGFFYKRKHGLMLGYVVGVVGRFVFSTISGLVFFTAYSPLLSESAAAVWASVWYNLSYILPEMVLTIIVLLLPPMASVMKRLRKMATANEV
ncbi:MAG: energy-coupled thiamine transporter ThiT [Clostridium sp.]|jgi:thiamine transporter|nr:energy-coupled thiamine transporter ThiT [Clostridium sp.]